MNMRLPAPGGSRGFTLIELLVCTGIAMAIAAVALSAFTQIRKAIARSEALLGLHQEAQVIYTSLEASFAGAQQNCAVVIYQEPGGISLIFMRGKEQKDDYPSFLDGNTSQGQKLDFSTQLVWEKWEWKRATSCVHAGVNRPMQKNIFKHGARRFRPSTVLPNGHDYRNSTFWILPQPRRYLDPTNPLGGPDVPPAPQVGRLDDNLWFPDPANTAKSLLRIGADPDPNDVGDFTDLQAATRAPSFRNVTDWAFQILKHDESLDAVQSVTLSDGTTVVVPEIFTEDGSLRRTVLQGVWPDGRLGSGVSRNLAALGPTQDLVGSDLASRPRLLRLRFTLTEPTSGVSQAFTFSFSWPGLATYSKP